MRTRFWLWGFAVIAYAATLCFLSIPYGIHGLFVSPDEHATWVFAQEIARTGLPQRIMSIPEGFSDIGGFLPRSVTLAGGYAVPVAFLGISYLGGVAYLFFQPLLAHLSPLFGILGCFSLFLLMRSWKYSQEASFFAASSLALHPAWWLYSARPLMPNVPFVSLLLLSAALAGSASPKTTIAVRRFFLSGIFLGLALTVRLSEWMWILGLLGASVVGWPSWWRVRCKELLVAAVGCCGVLVMLAALQVKVYGSWFATGYTLHAPLIAEVTGEHVQEQISASSHALSTILFPFGFAPRDALATFFAYGVHVFPAVFTLGLFACCVVFILYGISVYSGSVPRRDALMKAGSAVFLAASFGYLLVFYGSWHIVDNPDPQILTLGNSYARYWLPFAVAVAVGIGAAYDVLFETLRTHSRGMQRGVAMLGIVACTVYFATSVRVVFWGHDGLFPSRLALAQMEEKRSYILTQTPEHAMIIVDRADKFVWPDRAIRTPLRDTATYSAIPQLLAQGVPLYYFGITLPEEDVRFLSEEKYRNEGIVFSPRATIYDETLYEITLRN